jgi:autotransporter-like protein
VIKGAVNGVGLYSGVSATGLSIGGTGHAVNVAGGMTVTGTVAATALGASATAVHIGSGATVPQIVVGGSISAAGGGSAGASSTAILIDSGATVNSLFNSGSITATRSGDTGSAAAIVDNSGKLALVQNNGTIAVTGASALGDAGTAIDLRANTTGATVRQIAASGTLVPSITGNILFGTGNDTLDLQAGIVSGKVDFGGGSDLMNLSGNSIFRGTLANSAGLAVTVGTGSTLDVQNLGTVDLASLTAGAGSSIGVTIGDTGHTMYNVAGTASFGAGSKVVVSLDHVGTAAGTYTIIDAGTLTGGENLTSSIVTLPFLFNSELTSDAATGQVKLGVELKGSDEFGLNRSESEIIDAALDAADSDQAIAAVFLKLGDSATLKNTLQQLMPEQADGIFEMATKGPRLADGILSDPRPISGLWIQQVAWGSSKSIGDTSSYKLGSWGATIGYDVPVGPLGNVGVMAGYYFGKDSRLNNELVSDHYEGGLYWRGGTGPLRAWARATAGTIDFDSTRDFSAELNGGIVGRSTDGKWKGRLYSGSAGVSYEVRSGRLSIRPNASVEYYRLTEDGYSESGGGDAFDLVVRSRKSDESAANALLTLGYDFLAPTPEQGGWLRLEAEGGRRQIIGGSLGATVASFGDGTPFTLTPDERTSGWRGGLRVVAGGSGVSFGAEANAEQQQGHVSLGGRLAIRLDL